jgi:hypothetical protein
MVSSIFIYFHFTYFHLMLNGCLNFFIGRRGGAGRRRASALHQAPG